MAVVLPDRMLGPVRRWAVRELKAHRGQVVVVAGCPAPWTLSVLRGLVAQDGAVLVFEADARRAIQVRRRTDGHGWSNVAVIAEEPSHRELPLRADRVLLDDERVLASAEAVERLVSLLGPSGRLAAVCRRGRRGYGHLERRLPHLRRESFYGGAAYAVWGQIP